MCPTEGAAKARTERGLPQSITAPAATPTRTPPPQGTRESAPAGPILRLTSESSLSLHLVVLRDCSFGPFHMWLGASSEERVPLMYRGATHVILESGLMIAGATLCRHFPPMNFQIHSVPI